MSDIKLSLASVVAPTKDTQVEVPGYPGFIVSVRYLSREEMVKLRKKATKQRFDRKTRQPVEDLDEDLFLSLYVSSILRGWEGLKLKYLADLMPIDIGGQDLEATVAYDEDNALVLMKNSAEFDTFITETTGDLQNFTKSSSK